MALASTALAQTPPAREVQLARQLFVQGAEHAEAGRWAEAEVAFAGSLALYDRPRTLYNLATARAELGRLVEAAEDYRRFLREADTEKEAERLAAARTAVAELEQRIAQLTVEVRDLLEDDEVSVDDVPLPRAALGQPVPLDPGAHRVEVWRGEQQLAMQTVELAEGSRQSVLLTAPPPPPPSPEEAAAALEAQSGPSQSAPAGKPESRAWVWWTVGAAVVVAAGAGVAVALLSTQESGPELVEGNVSPGLLSVE